MGWSSSRLPSSRMSLISAAVMRPSVSVMAVSMSDSVNALDP